MSDPLRHFILGAAGHVDHGKTALVTALTGTNTDRLKEEQERGISIELGFAELDLGDGVHLGVVDMPGHEKFVKQMVSGAGGVDLAFLVIAADEGVMPQTVEHLEILDALRVRSGVVVITKIDMVDDDFVGVVTAEAADLVEGTFLEGKPIVAVSAHRGTGLDALRAAMKAEALALPRAAEQGAFRLARRPGVHHAGRRRGCYRHLLERRGLRRRSPGRSNPAACRCGCARCRCTGARPRAGPRASGWPWRCTGSSATTWSAGSRSSPRGRRWRRGAWTSALDLMKHCRRHGQESPAAARAPRRARGAGPHRAAGRAGTGRRDRAPARRWHSCIWKHDLVAAHGDRLVLRFYSPLVSVAGGMVLDAAPAPHKRFEAEVLAQLAVLETGSPEDLFRQEAARCGHRRVCRRRRGRVGRPRGCCRRSAGAATTAACWRSWRRRSASRFRNTRAASRCAWASRRKRRGGAAGSPAAPTSGTPCARRWPSRGSGLSSATASPCRRTARN